ncbi:Zn-dependent hydrolase [Halomonas sp. MC140]|nr:Zn-dependent hydrolase [Halomonas sp. MC140]MDN7134112.1 Zn-dependent hydrolase [Halomonas sp. MC140]
MCIACTRAERCFDPIEVIDFLSEETSDFGVSCVGSRGMAGALSTSMLELSEPSGEKLKSAILRMGGNPMLLGNALRGAGSIAAFLELHIEQGRVLENEGDAIGVVSGIVGISQYKLSIVGQADHAGTTPMNLRRDAMVCAAYLINNVHEAASLTSQSDDSFVATVGKVNVFPNASNSIPEIVEMELEIRGKDYNKVQEFVSSVMTRFKSKAMDMGVSVTVENCGEKEPVFFDANIMGAIEKSTNDLGLSSARLFSGAGHDAAYMANLAPVGMIFVPCQSGRSHCPEESITPEQAEAGCLVLKGSLKEIDAS